MNLCFDILIILLQYLNGYKMSSEKYDGNSEKLEVLIV